MGKRVATDQITKDDFESNRFYDNDDDEDQHQQPSKASSEVISSRKIIKPRGKLLNKSSPVNTNINNNGFKGLFSNSQPSQSQSPPQTSIKANEETNHKVRALNENFIDSINKLNQPNSIVDFTSIAEKYIHYYKQIHSDSKADVKPFTFNSNQNQDQVPRASAFSFTPISQDTISKPTVSAPAPASTQFSFNPSTTSSSSNFTFNTNKTASNASTNPILKQQEVRKAEKVENISSDSESEDEAMQNKKEIKIQGPQFTLNSNPTVKSSPFTFDPKKLAKKNAPDSDESEDEIEIKGPQFTFNKPIKDKIFKFSSQPQNSEEKKVDSNSTVFNFGKPTSENKPTSSKSFGSTSTDNTKAENQPQSETNSSKPFAFGLNSVTNQDSSTNKPISFGNSATIKQNEATNSKTFTFGSNTSTKPADSTASKPFAFGSKNTPAKPEESIPITLTKKDEHPTTTSTKPFSFGSSNTKQEESTTTTTTKPFTFGGSNTNDKLGFNFGTTSTTKETEVAKPSFNFNPKPTTDNIAKPFGEFNNTQSEDKPKSNPFGSTDKPTFSFNKPSTDSTNKPSPSFSFTNNPETKSNEGQQATSSLFGNTAKPAFNFGSSTEKKEEATNNAGFKFGFSSNNTSSGFQFGSKPATSFGTNLNGTPTLFGSSSSTTTSSTTDKPTFNFSSNNNNNAFGASTNPFGGKPDEKKVEDADDDKVPEEETGGDFAPVASLSNEKVSSETGEENEDLQFTVRAKLMEYNKENKEDPYKNKGVGELKILTNKSTGKSRILLRADGSFRVLLNTSISKSISYTKLGNANLITIPTIDPNDTTKLITYVIRVRNAKDGEEMLKKIDELKQ
ncbi:unnamed protein product [Candida verbasci]|uniref:RanBD1 domain-containing protein n=1 Tax=Candida verbasci TaxID=1227364 RepID=A0A9W4TZ98_9ASCO|nr:unnamed protein product [Candida verbasci]